MNSWILRIVWPIEDAAVMHSEAIAAAWFEVPDFAEQQQATVCGAPKFRVVDCSEMQRIQLGAVRAVVCEVPVIRRNSTTEMEAA